MAFSRYTALTRPGNIKTMSRISSQLRQSIARGETDVETIILEEGVRLDHLAARYYSDPSYWWIIAAASSIGWGLQAPPGTVITVPRDLGAVISLVLCVVLRQEMLTLHLS